MYLDVKTKGLLKRDMSRPPTRETYMTELFQRRNVCLALAKGVILRGSEHSYLDSTCY